MNSVLPRLGLLLALPLAVSAQTDVDDDAQVLDLGAPIVVTADFRQVSLSDLAASVTVIDADTIRQREAGHLEGILNLAPNVNFAGGASRGQYFQIRGIGERSQFIEPINPSVGLLVDGIDLTGVGGAATLTDMAQVEVLRGPQGTLLGANALAGMINMLSADPTEVLGGRFETRLGERGLRTVEGAVGGPISENLGFRVAYSNYQSDGYQKNAFLGVRDTGRIDEQTLRARLAWQLHERLTIDLTGLYLDIDNGYDGFSLDNTRTTLSDEPGHDRQETRAVSLRMNWQAHPAFNLETVISHLDADLEYGYDEDWSFVGICEVFECLASPYASFDNYLRTNRNTTVDLRAVSNNRADQLGWVLGAYYRDQSQFLRREYTYQAEDFLRDFDSENRALYGQLDIPLASRLTLKTGLRYEQRKAVYEDSDGARFRPDENFWGGRLALEYRTTDRSLLYGLVSRGYKAGGVNSDPRVPADLREYDTETLWNYELGLKTRLLDGRMDLRAALFYQDRDGVQAQQSLVTPIEGDACPCRFIEYKTNATAGRSYGLETELNWYVNRHVQAFASLGLMRSRFDGFLSFSHVDADRQTGQPVNLDGRELPHAPSYMFAVGALFQLSDRWYLRTEIEGKDGFFFSARHDAKARSYELLHARLGYQTARWDVAVWARNITNEDIRIRGFGGFGNDPRKGYIVEPYYQFGEPRTVGVTASYAF